MCAPSAMILVALDPPPRQVVLFSGAAIGPTTGLIREASQGHLRRDFDVYHRVVESDAGQQPRAKHLLRRPPRRIGRSGHIIGHRFQPGEYVERLEIA